MNSELARRKRTLFHTSATSPGGDENISRGEIHSGRRTVRDDDPVAAHRPGGTIEHGGLTGVLPANGPVPVGLGPFVAALFAEGFLVEVHVVAVEAEEEAVAVDEVGPEAVRADEVVIAGSRARERRRVGAGWGLAGFLGEAVDCVDVV